MQTMLSFVLALGFCYLIGSLPLGSALIKWATGKEARTLCAHNLGVENLFYYLGAPLAFGSFFLDMFKGFVAVTLFAGSPWAALGRVPGPFVSALAFGVAAGPGQRRAARRAGGVLGGGHPALVVERVAGRALRRAC